LVILKITGNFKFLPPKWTNDIHYPIKKDTEVEHRSIISTIYRIHRHKKKFKKNIKTYIIVKSVHLSFHSESKKTHIIVKSV